MKILIKKGSNQVRKSCLVIFLVILTLAFWAPDSSAALVNLVSNGDFTGTITDNSGKYQTVTAGSSQIADWTVGGSTADGNYASVDWIGTLWSPPPGSPAGSHSIDLDGTSPTGGNAEGSISQTINNLSPNTTYTVSFDLAGNPGGGNIVVTVNAGVTSVFSGTFSSIAYSPGSQTLLWAPESFTFTTEPSQTSITLTFASATSGQYGPVIANISMYAVPIPASALLLGSGLLGLGFLTWRGKIG